ncbi:MAG: MBOAT family protein, partial [Deltaproteobacteria bacterium]|nr:MBOAT family protein [Deltaproteobacteria bacterium]
DGLERILFGLSKKLIVADSVARLTAPVWQDPLQYDPGILWLAAYGYAVQIYADFSGYSDIAIGSAKLLGFKVEENFNWPYLRPNIREFWRNWHMSLTSWITDYLYIPLGGNRRGERRTNVNTIVSMSLCGLWHGAALHFVAWGFYHGVAICIQRTYSRWRDRTFPTLHHVFPRTRQAVATVFTFHVVVIGWMYFVLNAVTATRVICKMLLLPPA